MTMVMRKLRRNLGWVVYDDIDSLQSMIVMIPIFKTVQLSVFAINLGTCYGSGHLAVNMQRYLLMLLVATETVSRTAIACFFYLIANGWGILRFDYDPLEATNCAKFLGIAYLCHSSYFVTVGSWRVHLYIRGVLILFYLVTCLKIIRRTLRNQMTLKRNVNYLRTANLYT